ncbi:adenosylcobinamide-GDP ribazoletransferase [Myxococcota bacterium]|nr:adenosylcobinamide-GDP ribazoletransferase [Myxococcota bacterium]
MRRLTLALIFLTRLPARLDGQASAQELGASTANFPLVGALIGLVTAAVFGLGLKLGLPDLAAAVIALLAQVMLTGALHEDGLGDVADAFGGGWDAEAKLRILKDSRQGTYGVLAIAGALLARASALSALPAETALLALPAVHAASRAAMVLLLATAPAARQDGLAAALVGVDLKRPAALGLALAAAVSVGLCGRFGLAALGLALVSAGLMGALARRQIGGVTGDVLGASQQLGEVAGLLAASALVTEIGWGA